MVRIHRGHVGQNDLMWAKRVYAPSCSQEWLETDGLGGFASSTTSGIHTRRYHGWLFLASRDPGERFLALSKLEDSCQNSEGSWDLSANFYPGVIYPKGLSNLWSFQMRPFPKSIFRVGQNFLAREIFMVKGKPGVYCVYSFWGETLNGSDRPMLIRFRPLCQNRFYHHVGNSNNWSPTVTPVEGGVLLDGHHVQKGLLLLSEPSQFQPDPKWYKDVQYPRERERGLDWSEDLFCPGEFTSILSPGETVVFWAGPKTETTEGGSGLRYLCSKARRQEIARRLSLTKRNSPVLSRLNLAGDQFFVKAPSGCSIIAGYHWFGEWGRDSFIAMPGILLRNSRFDEARQVFVRFLDALDGGMVPNMFYGRHGKAYNSVDATLWMIRALGLYEKKSGDTRFIQSVLPQIRSIVLCYTQGTRFGIKADSLGLLRAGQTGADATQVTWMDASVNGIPVTPRSGYPVEVNALWILSLFLLAKWEGRYGEKNNGYWDMAKKTMRQFAKKFSWPGWGLYDGLDDLRQPIAVLRPNSVLAASFLKNLLPQTVLLETFKNARRWLLVPGGLRTLGPLEEGYTGTYGGGPAERDGAYHQGTAWPWLLGAYFDLQKHIWPRLTGKALERELAPILAGLVDLDSSPCLGTVPELVCGDWPYQFAGAVSQAWSVGELARIVDMIEQDR